MNTYNKNDPETIQEMFQSIARDYDKTNAIISFNMYLRWNNSLINQALLPYDPKTILDLCCGTGDIAFSYLKKIDSHPKVYLLDFCEGMLHCAKEKAVKLRLNHHNLNYLKADAQAIPLTDSSIDCATISYGIRNVKDPSRCIRDVYRVLKPGGIFGILELTKPANPLLGILHSLYTKGILPILGKMATSNQSAYQYLGNSVQAFDPNLIDGMMKSAGFLETKRKTHLGGVVTIFTGKKPL